MDKIIDISIKFGQVYTLNICLESNDPIDNKYPGMYAIDQYDQSFIEIIKFKWFICNDKPCLSVDIDTIQLGKTQVKAIIKPNQFNPLYLTYIYQINIL